MAKCDQGYLCEVCGNEVPEMTDSDLYLRYILGEVNAHALMSTPERHLRCNPTVTQFIVDERFEPVVAEGPFAKSELPPEEVARMEDLVSRAYRRLMEVRSLGIPISQYPLERMES